MSVSWFLTAQPFAIPRLMPQFWRPRLVTAVVSSSVDVVCVCVFLKFPAKTIYNRIHVWAKWEAKWSKCSWLLNSYDLIRMRQRQTHKPFSRTSMESPCAALSAILLWLLFILRIFIFSNCNERPFPNKGRDWDDFVDLFVTLQHDRHVIRERVSHGHQWSMLVLRWGEVGSATFWMSGKRLVCLILGTCKFD